MPTRTRPATHWAIVAGVASASTMTATPSRYDATRKIASQVGLMVGYLACGMLL